MALTDSTTTQQTQNFFSPEGLEALRRDLEQLQTVTLPRLLGVHGSMLDVLTGKTPLDLSQYAQPTKAAAALGRTATTGALAEKGASPQTGSALDTYLMAQTPDLLQPLGALARNEAASTTSLVDPRLAAYLRPDTVTSSQTTPSPLATITDILKTAGSIASVFA